MRATLPWIIFRCTCHDMSDKAFSVPDTLSLTILSDWNDVQPRQTLHWLKVALNNLFKWLSHRIDMRRYLLCDVLIKLLSFNCQGMSYKLAPKNKKFMKREIIDEWFQGIRKKLHGSKWNFWTLFSFLLIIQHIIFWWI